MKGFLRLAAVLAIATVVNLGLYLLVPYIQVLIQRSAVAAHRSVKTVTTEVAVAPPQQERERKREIKVIKTQAIDPPQPNPSRPATPGGGLKIDLSVAGGEGLALVSGGDRTGGIGSGTGGGKGEGMAAMTYEIGQTDTDPIIVGLDPKPRYPSRAEREGVSGKVDVTFVVNEAGLVEQISIIKEEPTGYGFGNMAIEAAKKLRFKPATMHKMPVRIRVKRPYSFGSEN